MSVKRLVIALIAVCGLIALSHEAMARRTARGAFASAPHSVFPLLNEMTRLDMIDYYESGLKIPSRNQLGGECVIERMTHGQLDFKMSDVSSYSINIVKEKKDSAIILISTYRIPALDSGISFYDMKWNPLDGERFTAPSLKDWLSSDAKPVMEDIENAVPFVTASYDFDPESGVLTLTPTLRDLVGKEEYDLVKKYLKPQILYRWNGKKMKMVK